MSMNADLKAFDVATPVIILAGMTGNFIVCCLIITNKKLRTSFNYLLLNLAISDLSCLLFASLFYAGKIRNLYFSDGNLLRPDFEGIACKVTIVSIDLTTKISVFTLAAISTDRFYAIVYPWKHRKASITTKIRILLLVIWLVAVICCLPMMVIMAKIPNRFEGESIAPLCLKFLVDTDKFKVIAFIDLIAAYIIPMAIILRTSVAVIKHLWCHCWRRTRREEGKLLVNSRKRITKIVFSVIVAFNIFWLPWAVLQGSLLIGVVHEINGRMFLIMFSLVLISASVNPILYSIQSRLFRKGVIKMLRCKSI
ncbi:RYamide receptor-like [Stylophora pistillata]|uniref:RYamide receptor-like n=1 Tax=Stylophora pistillata TaxID=50429 RepID=UPI000C040D08|nr:RYamide receptor-like [Stylophora pistillata]